MSGPNDDAYAREVVKAIDDMRQEVVAARQQMSRATLPLYERIVSIEQAFTTDRKERKERQEAIDSRFDQQDDTLDELKATTKRLGASVGGMNITVRVLSASVRDMRRRSGWRLLIELAILGGVVLALLLWVLR